jgi:periplasmic divalent cation tolerance protein
MDKYIQVITTVNKRRLAKEMAKQLLEKRAAACVQILPSRSFYRWEGNIENQKEFVLLIKGKDFQKIGNIIKEMHPYKVPEIIATQITSANKEYLEWIDQSTQ